MRSIISIPKIVLKAALFLVGAVVILSIVAVSIDLYQITQQHDAQVRLANAKTACNLDPQTFLNTVNQWRAAKNIAPLQLSTQLTQAAQARIADMQQYKYYGHENPQTKQDNVYFVQKYDPAATWDDEVLDGPNNALQSLTNFKNSQPHYTALTDSRENYMGIVAEYLPESWAAYNNKGQLVAHAGTYHSNCIVVADLADKIGQPVATTTQSVAVTTQTRQQVTNCELLSTTEINNLSNFERQQMALYTTASELGHQQEAATQYNSAVSNVYNSYVSTLINAGCTNVLAGDSPNLLQP